MSESIDVDPLSTAGWQMHLEIATPGGFVASGVRHYDCYFATDIRVTRIFLSDKDQPAPGEAWEYELGSGPPMPGSTSHLLKATGEIVPTTIDAKMISPYRPVNAWSARFETEDGFVGKDTPKLAIRQTYAVTDYGNSPPHEPSGVLQAARFYPLVTVYDPTVDGELKRLRYVRVDYRLGLSCGNYPARVQGGLSARPLNQAGVFHDSDAPPTVVTAETLFPSAEKPLKYEILGRGLLGGKKAAWDNIHQWIAGERVATPGAQYAIHNHWRWTAAAAGPAALSFPAPGKQFAQKGGVPGSALIDPGARQQALTFAITGGGTPSTTPEPPNWSAGSREPKPDFDRLFTDARAKPAEIEQGANLTTWMSFEVFRDPPYTPAAFTLFTHGIFFAHNVGEFNLPLFVVGAYANRQVPAPVQKWLRPY